MKPQVNLPQVTIFAGDDSARQWSSLGGDTIDETDRLGKVGTGRRRSGCPVDLDYHLLHAPP